MLHVRVKEKMQTNQLASMIVHICIRLAYLSIPGRMHDLNSAHTGLWSDVTMLGTESYAMHSSAPPPRKLAKLLPRRSPSGIDFDL